MQEWNINNNFLVGRSDVLPLKKVLKLAFLINALGNTDRRTDKEEG